MEPKGNTKFSSHLVHVMVAHLAMLAQQQIIILQVVVQAIIVCISILVVFSALRVMHAQIPILLLLFVGLVITRIQGLQAVVHVQLVVFAINHIIILSLALQDIIVQDIQQAQYHVLFLELILILATLIALIVQQALIALRF